MKKLIIIFLIAFSINANAQIEFEEDYSFKRDKQYHIGVGSVLGAGIFTIIYHKTQDARLSRRGARIFSALPIMAKEGFDMLSGGDIMLGDMLYGFIGVEIGAEISYIIVRHREKKQAKRIKELYDISENITFSLDNPIFNTK